jgi:cytochrome b pre-mRNA-processing protein 3
MSFLSRLLAPKDPPLAALWRRIAEVARQPHWYAAHGVPDTLDGRFDMVALVTALVMLRLEAAGEGRQTALLTERFVEDMDGSLREIGVGDMVVGKHIGNMVGALGGRIGAYREALASADREAAMAQALSRNVWRGAAGEGDPAGLARAILAFAGRLESAPIPAIIDGRGF